MCIYRCMCVSYTYDKFHIPHMKYMYYIFLVFLHKSNFIKSFSQTR